MKFLIAAAVVGLAAADCPNACSGNGLCRDHDACKCDPGFTGNDCSQRVCPFESAFVDTARGDLNHDGLVSNAWVKVPWSNKKEYEMFPSGGDGSAYAPVTGEGHFYAECSGKGECDRGTGECKCYSGYTGSACQRATCPKDCSGHGVCRTMREIAKGALNKRVSSSFAGHNRFSGVRTAFDYNLWDADKNQACVCDPGFSGVDCSLRQCPRGDDPLTTAERYCGNAPCKYEVQSFTLSNAGPTTYKLGFTDYTNNTNYAYVTVDVAGNAQGLGFIAEMDDNPNGSNKENSLPGPNTVAGQIQAALRAVPGGLLQRVEVYPAGSNPVTNLGRTFRVTFTGYPGDAELMTVAPYQGLGALDQNPDAANAKSVKETTRGNFEAVECSGRGLCDTSAGLCKCFGGFFGSACEYLNALAA
jgi:hypothetical protein